MILMWWWDEDDDDDDDDKYPCQLGDVPSQRHSQTKLPVSPTQQPAKEDMENNLGLSKLGDTSKSQT